MTTDIRPAYPHQRPQWKQNQKSKRHSTQVGGSADEQSDAEGPYDSADEHSIEIFLPTGSRYPTLKPQPLRLRRAIRTAYKIAEFRVAFQTAYPPPDNPERFYREILRDAARELEDDELAQQFKTNADYGNRVAHLVRLVLASPLISV